MAVSREFKRNWRERSKNALLDYCGGQCVVCGQDNYDKLGLIIYISRSNDWAPWVYYAPAYGTSWAEMTSEVNSHAGTPICEPCLRRANDEWEETNGH